MSRARGREKRANTRPAHHREQHQADKILDRRDDVAVIGLRMHVAVADGRRRLDAEEEQIGEALTRVGDRRVAEVVDEREERD